MEMEIIDERSTPSVRRWMGKLHIASLPVCGIYNVSTYINRYICMPYVHNLGGYARSILWTQLKGNGRPGKQAVGGR